MKTLHEPWGGSASTAKRPAAGSIANLASRGGLAFFWVLNDECDPESLLRQLDGFQRAGIEGLVLHPRNGLLLPYGGSDWFSLIRWLVAECLRRGIEPILYDEDPYPSGNASGRIVAEHPEHLAHEMERFIAPESLGESELFLFPAGRLCWAGIVFPDDPETAPVDLTSCVGMIRRHWEKAEWDSRWYYPATPVYPHPRAFAHHPEFGLRRPEIPAGGRLEAFVARPVRAANEWGTLVDALNPRATRLFLECTHERYSQTLGRELGRGASCFFTDEPKPHASYSWTPGLFEDFKQAYGYDLRPRLNLLFGQDENPLGMRVRLDYREWITRRFDRAWMKPVARWCAGHRVALIGHLSPEEDPVSQSASIGNVFPPQKRLSLSGYDLIIPAIGDARHPLLNVGPIIAASAAQQNRKPGVCCESLGAFGLDVTTQVIARTLAWQLLHGATLGVLHGAFSSQLGLRRYEAPADYGTNAPNWPSIQEVCRKLAPYFKASVNATQDAPVAILWPIRSFQALGALWQEEDAGLRRDLLELMQCCLENQIGIHFLDEEDLARARIHKEKGKLSIGRASYRWVLIPSLTIIGESTLEILERAAASGVSLAGAGRPPAWVRATGGSLKAAAKLPWPSCSLEQFRSGVLPRLPRLLDLPAAVRSDFHVSGWRAGSRQRLYLMHMGEEPHVLEIGGASLELRPGDLLWLERKRKGWALHERFSPAEFADTPAADASTAFQEWEMQVPGRPPVRAPQPMGVWQLLPTSGPKLLRLITTGDAHVGGGEMADRIFYRAKIHVPAHFTKACLLVEPTLMRGHFTLEINGERWRFRVADTDRAAQKIDLSRVLKPGEQQEICFVLYKPEAMDGIKHSPRLEFKGAEENPV